MLDAQSVTQAMALITSARRLCAICHRNPDGDAIGSITAIAELCSLLLPDIPVKLTCVDPSPSTFDFLPWTQRIEANLDPREGDVFIFVDSAEPKLTDYHERFPQIFSSPSPDGLRPAGPPSPDGLRPAGPPSPDGLRPAGARWPSICFDHHPGNSNFAMVNLVVPSASSTCEIITDFAQRAGLPITPSIATSLLTGIYTDTGGLLHSNTAPRVYRTVATLLRAGARQQTIVQHVFRTAKPSTLRLWGRVLEKITLTAEGGAISALTEGDFKATGAEYSELTGAIDYVNAIPGMKFSLLLAERQGKVKGSLRTLRDDVDVSKMAATFQGGGHKRAAGFALPGKLVPEVRWKVEQ